MCLNNNKDILHVNYQFAKNKHFTSISQEDQERWMYEDVQSVVEEILT